MSETVTVGWLVAWPLISIAASAAAFAVAMLTLREIKIARVAFVLSATLAALPVLAWFWLGESTLWLRLAVTTLALLTIGLYLRAMLNLVMRRAATGVVVLSIERFTVYGGMAGDRFAFDVLLRNLSDKAVGFENDWTVLATLADGSKVGPLKWNDAAQEIRLFHSRPLEANGRVHGYVAFPQKPAIGNDIKKLEGATVVISLSPHVGDPVTARFGPIHMD